MSKDKKDNGWGSMYKTSAFTYNSSEDKKEVIVEPMPSIMKQIMDKAKKTLLG